MKMAAVLCVVIAMVIAGWAISDYMQNEHDQQWNHTFMQKAILGNHAASVQRISEDEDRLSESQNRDGILGIVAFTFLIAAVALFSVPSKAAVVLPDTK